jgi:hypothetical protein
MRNATGKYLRAANTHSDYDPARFGARPLMKSTRAFVHQRAHSGTTDRILRLTEKEREMDANSSAHFYAWMDDGEMPVDTSTPTVHRSAQVAGEPEYVAEICNRFAGEKAEEEQKPCVIRGYN